MANCTHGFPQGQCLICSTLARTPGQAGSATAVAERARAGTPASGLDSSLARPSASLPLPTPKKGAREEPPARGGVGSKLVLALVVVLAGLVAWALFRGIFDLVLRIAEYVAVAAVAGWVGYKTGHYRGKRAAEREGRGTRKR